MVPSIICWHSSLPAHSAHGISAQCAGRSLHRCTAHSSNDFAAQTCGSRLACYTFARGLSRAQSPRPGPQRTTKEHSCGMSELFPSRPGCVWCRAGSRGLRSGEESAGVGARELPPQNTNCTGTVHAPATAASECPSYLALVHSAPPSATPPRPTTPPHLCVPAPAPPPHPPAMGRGRGKHNVHETTCLTDSIL